MFTYLFKNKYRMSQYEKQPAKIIFHTDQKCDSFVQYETKSLDCVDIAFFTPIDHNYRRWTSTIYNIDSSEAVCSEFQGYCDTTSSKCVASDGSAYCECRSGYKQQPGNDRLCAGTKVFFTTLPFLIYETI